MPTSPNALKLPLLALAAALAITPARAELVATFTRDGVTDSRLDRFPALAIQPGEPATPFLTPGSFQVVWKGKLVLSKRERLVFSFEGEGTAGLKIDGKEVLSGAGNLAEKPSPSTRLNPGEHEFELSYSSKPDGSAAFRIYWEEASFTRQTIPPSAFKAEATEATTLGALQRRGRLVFANQSCVKCHSATAGFGASPMPETAEIGPILFGAGDRVSEDWLRKWISAPQVLKPTTHMPALVDVSTEQGRQQAGDLAAYVAGLKTGAPAGPATDPALAEEGGLHFHELGCVACHNLPDKGLTDPTRVPLNNVASKYLPGALVAFLKQPDAYHPFIKMPNFRLSDAEANSIAAYLSKASSGQETKLASEIPAGDATRGATVAASLQCGVCHPGMPMAPDTAPAAMDVIFKKDWSSNGCVAPADKRGKAPHLNLDDNDRAALVAFSKVGSDSLSRDTPAEYAMRQTTALRCTSCHGLDGQAPLLSGYHSESEALAAHVKSLHERVDQSRPALSFTGEMLYTTAIESMIAGTAEPRPRPWLAMRMPSFKTQAAPLAKGFSKLHGVEPNKPAEVKVDPATAEIGKTLAGATGFGCTTCHGIGDIKPTAAFEVEGINFKFVPDRLRADYYHRWMDDPKSVTPATKMPLYSTDGKSQRTDVLEGDAKKQFEAIWQYIHQK
ncbi:MAG: c-type cytochrome [Verrucomicrobiota bacterium]